jgi:LmbE family N-acetylglucosaminyl deacetylase
MSRYAARLFHPSARPRTILGVWAHPDDEAFLSAAFMAQAVRAGHRVVVATATRGEDGTSDPERFPPEVLGPIREAELASSLEVLGVAEHRWLGGRLQDGTLDAVPADVGRDLVTQVLRDVRPDLIVTFGPDGLTGHDDHRAVSRWTTDAWHAEGCPGDLWYAALTQSFLDRWGALCDEMGVWMSPEPPAPVTDAAVVHIQSCDTDLAARKLAALQAHHTQTSGLIDQLGEQTFARWWSYEFFAAAV